MTIADLVADHRAPTPSAAAEAATHDTVALGNEVFALAQQAGSRALQLVREHSQWVASSVQRMQGRLPDVGVLRQRVDDLTSQGLEALHALFGKRREQTQALEAQLGALSPTAVLSRGYAVLVHEGTGAIVSSVGQIGQGDRVRATVKDGQFVTRVEP